MARAKQYSEQGVLLQAPQPLTDAPIRESINQNERINRFLGAASEYFYSEAKNYATEQALDYAIRNPITKDQILQAQKTGDNPVDDYLKGGRIYNEAITKVLGQQVAGELNIDLHKHQANILEQVRLGQITNSEQMIAVLKEPLQTQIEFLSQFDPELAAQYGANSAITTRNNILKADAIFADKKEEQAQVNAQEFINNSLDDYAKYLDAYPTATTEQRKVYRDTLLKIARDHSFSMSREQVKLSLELEDKLIDAEDRNVATDIAQRYVGKSIAEVMQALPDDGSEGSVYYKNKDLKDREVLQIHINHALSIVNAGQNQLQKEVKYNIEKAKDFINRQQPIPNNISEFIEKNIDKDSLEYVDWTLTQEFSDNIKLYNDTPLLNKDGTGLVDTYLKMQERQLDVNTQTSYEENKKYDLLGQYIKNVQAQLKDDFVGAVLKRAGVYEKLTFENPEILATQIEKRKKDLAIYGSFYGQSEADMSTVIMSKAESSAFVNAYMKGDGKTRVGMLQMIDQSFGDSNGAALLQLINEGLPTTAELSSYFNDPRKTEIFLSFDEEDERKRLEEVATRKGTSYNEITKQVSAKLQPFLEIVMRQNGFNKSTATKKMDNIFDALTYYAINELQSGKSINAAVDEATKLINDGFQIEDTYYIPKLYNGEPVDADAIATKAKRIKDLHLRSFDPLPFPTIMEGIDESEIKETMRNKMIENGEWRNTADGTGLVFGIVMSDGSFGLVENADGENLTFKFNDLSPVVPTTEVDITAPKGETRIEYMGRKRREQMSKEEYKKRYGVEKGTR